METLERQAELAGRLRGVAGLQSRETVERQVWSKMRTFQGRA